MAVLSERLDVGRSQVHLREHAIVLREAEIDPGRMHEADEQQPRADEQRLRQRELADDERLVTATDAAMARDALADAPEIVGRGARRLHRRAEAEHDRGQERHREREQQHGRVHRDLREPRQVSRRHEDERAHAGDRERESGDAAGHRDRQRLDQQLPDDAGSIGAERVAHRDLGLPRRRLSEQQMRDVGARDQQQHRHGNLQQHDQRPHVADDLFVKRHDAGAEAGVRRRIPLATARSSRS